MKVVCTARRFSPSVFFFKSTGASQCKSKKYLYSMVLMKVNVAGFSVDSPVSRIPFEENTDECARQKGNMYFKTQRIV